MDKSKNAAMGQEQSQQARENTAERQNVRYAEKEQETVREEKKGVVTRNFQFSASRDRIEQVLQQPRTQEYLVAMDLIDFLSSDDEEIIERLQEKMGEEFVEEVQEMTDEEIFEMITKAVHEQFAELETTYDDTLIAVLSKCYIDGCNCHAIDSEGHILAHYRVQEELPEDLERGRAVFLEYQSECQCVEVYRQNCRVIKRSGEVESISRQRG